MVHSEEILLLHLLPISNYYIDNGWIRRRYRGIMTEAKAEVIMPITPEDLPIIYCNVESRANYGGCKIMVTPKSFIESKKNPEHNGKSKNVLCVFVETSVFVARLVFVATFDIVTVLVD